MAGFLDKAKQAAQQALDEAKKGIDSGQAKLDEVQLKRESDRLLAALGASFYAEQRHGGSRDAVNAAMTAIDSHVQANGLIGFPADAFLPGESPSPSSTATATQSPPNQPSPSAPPPGPAPTLPTTSSPPPAAEGGSAYDLPPS